MKKDVATKIPNLQENKKEERAGIDHFVDPDIYITKKWHSMPLTMEMYKQSTIKVPEQVKSITSKDQQAKCHGKLCQKVMKISHKATTIQPEETNSNKIKENAISWLTGIRFNIYHLVFHLIRELEQSLYRRQREKKCSLVNGIENSTLIYSSLNICSNSIHFSPSFAHGSACW